MPTIDGVPDLRQLNTFLTIVDEGGFGAAARRLCVSQPSVSQQMRRLEERLGHRLFTREGSTNLTSDGAALVIFARSMFAVADQVRAYFQQSEVEGVLRLGFNEDFARTALPAVLNVFALAYPNIELSIDCNFSSRQLFVDLDEGKLDLVVAKLPATRIRGELLWREPLRWLGRSSTLRFAEGSVPLVTASEPNTTRDVVCQALADAGRTWRIRFRSPSLHALEAAVGAGLGISAIMKSMIKGDLVVLDDGCGLPPLPDLALCLDVRPDAAEPAVRAFAALLREAMLRLHESPPTV